MTPLWHVALAMAGEPQDAWLDLVSRASGQDGATASVEELRASAERLCAENIAGACSFADWGMPFDAAAARAALDPACDAGDPVACLVSGWALGQRPWGTWAQQIPTAVDARLRVERACALGLPRGCVEVARALFHGVGSTARPNKARERLDVSCRAREASACGALGVVTRDPATKRDMLVRAVDLGFVPALRPLALLPGVDPVPFHDAACAAGLGASCRDLAALDSTRTREALEAGCHVQHLGSCTDLAVARFAEGETGPAIAALDRLCTRLDEACARAALLRLDVEPRVMLPGSLRPVDRGLLESELQPGLRRCYVARLGRGDVDGPMSLFVQVGPTGRVEGAAVLAAYADVDLQRCVDTAARRLMPTVPPGGGPALVRLDTFLGHVSDVRFRPHATSPTDDEPSVIDALAALSPALETCALLDPSEAAPMAVEIVVRPRGQVTVVAIVRSSEVAAIDACVAGVLRSTRVLEAEDRHEGLLLVRFLQALGQPEPEQR